MSSAFNSDVYATRRRYPWAEIEVGALMNDLTNYIGEVKLTCRPRKAVRTRLWWSCAWTDADGKERMTEGETLQLCLWRAALREMETRDQMEREQKEKEQKP